jgi:hypothetical protein
MGHVLDQTTFTVVIYGCKTFSTLTQISGEFCAWLRGLPEGEDDTVNKTTPEYIWDQFYKTLPSGAIN